MVRAMDGHGLRITSRPPCPAGTGSPDGVTTSGTMPGKGTGGGAGLSGNRAWKRCDHDGAGFRLPPGVDDRAAAFADHIAIPHPGFRIDWLAYSSEQAETVEAVFLRILISPLDECADRRRRRVEDGDLVLVDDLPEAVEIGKVRRALVHERGDAVLQDSVDDVGVSCDPADVGRAPVDVVLFEIEDQLAGQIGLDGIAAGRMYQALGLAGGARGVKDVQRIFGVQLLSRAIRRCSCHQIVPPVVSAGGACGSVSLTACRPRHSSRSGSSRRLRRPLPSALLHCRADRRCPE